MATTQTNANPVVRDAMRSDEMPSGILYALTPFLFCPFGWVGALAISSVITPLGGSLFVILGWLFTGAGFAMSLVLYVHTRASVTRTLRANAQEAPPSLC